MDSIPNVFYKIVIYNIWGLFYVAGHPINEKTKLEFSSLDIKLAQNCSSIKLRLRIWA